MIGVDASEEMLMQAMDHTIDLEPRPIFLNQRMEDLDLYGTVDACVCCLDSINYITDISTLREAFRRVELFLEPGGIFIFDVNTKHKFDSMHGECYVGETKMYFVCGRLISMVTVVTMILIFSFVQVNNGHVTKKNM